MKAKEYLEQVRMLNTNIEKTLSKIERCEAQLAVMGISFDGERCVKDNENRTTMKMVEFAGYREDLETLQDYYIEQEKEASYVISSITNPTKQRAVSLHYVEGLSMSEIARKMGYTKSNIQYHIESAVEDLDRRLVHLIQDYKQS